MKQQGFTLLELITALIILMLILTLGLPGFSSQIQKTRTRTAALELMHAVHHTRTLAASKNKRATLTHLGQWEAGWEAFIDNNNNGLRDQDEEPMFQAGPVKAVAIYTNRPVKKYVSFIGTGESRLVGRADAGGFQAGRFRVCSPETQTGYALILARSGRMRIEELAARKCVPFKS